MNVGNQFTKMTVTNSETRKYLYRFAQTPLEIPGLTNPVRNNVSNGTKKSKFLTGPPAFSRAGQTTLEFTLCFVVLIMLFSAGFMAFKWAAQTITERQVGFEGTRNSDFIYLDSFYNTPEPDLKVKFQ